MLFSGEIYHCRRPPLHRRDKGNPVSNFFKIVNKRPPLHCAHADHKESIPKDTQLIPITAEVSAEPCTASEQDRNPQPHIEHGLNDLYMIGRNERQIAGVVLDFFPHRQTSLEYGLLVDCRMTLCKSINLARSRPFRFHAKV